MTSTQTLTCTACDKQQFAQAELWRGVTEPGCSVKSGDVPASLFSGRQSILQGACDPKADPLGCMLVFHTWALAQHSERTFQRYLCFLLMTKRNTHTHMHSSTQNGKYSLTDSEMINIIKENAPGKQKSPGRCGSVGWALSQAPRSHWLDSQARHMLSCGFDPHEICVGDSRSGFLPHQCFSLSL